MVQTLERALNVRWGECRSGAEKNRADVGRRYARANALQLGRSFTDVPRVVAEPVATPRKAYYPGLALLRIAAAVGVIQIHAGAQSGPWVDGFRALMVQERVPTFMLMALFLTVEGQIEEVTIGKLFRRLRQLMVPMMAWTLIYDGSKLIRHGVMGHWQTALAPFMSPAEQLLGKGWHLYFLTWLATGTVVACLLVTVTKCLIGRFRWTNRIGLSVAGATILAGCCALNLYSGKIDLISRVIPAGALAEQGLKLVSGIGGYALSSAPYIAIALMIHAVRSTAFRTPARPLMLLGAGAMALNLVIARWAVVFPLLSSWLGATGGLVFGLSIPQSIRLPKWVHNAARASYGIFLSHWLILIFYEALWTRISHQSMGQLGFVSFVAVVVLTFLTSWFITVQLQRFAFTRRVLLGAN